MLDLITAERSAIESENFPALKSILLEKERLIQEISHPYPSDWIDEVRGVIEQIIQHGKENEKLISQKWLDNRNELKKISDARNILIARLPKQTRTPRLVDRKC